MIENKIANAHKFELNECIFCLKKSESFDAYNLFFFLSFSFNFEIYETSIFFLETWII